MKKLKIFRRLMKYKPSSLDSICSFKNMENILIFLEENIVSEVIFFNYGLKSFLQKTFSVTINEEGLTFYSFDIEMEEEEFFEKLSEKKVEFTIE